MTMRKLVDNDDLEVVQLVLGPFENNVYVVKDRAAALCAVIDAATSVQRILEAVGDARLVMILQTHTHMDHTQALQALREETGAPVAIHPQEPETSLFHPEIVLQDGERLMVGNQALDVLHTPGHTPGSVCFLMQPNLCFCGDTVFPGGPGKTSSPKAFLQIVDSLEKKIYALPDEVLLLSGHGESIRVGDSRREYEAFRSRPRRKTPWGDVLWEEA